VHPHRTYDVKLGEVATAYKEAVLALPDMVEWSAAAADEADDVEELEMEF
jgi:glutathione S-transferase